MLEQPRWQVEALIPLLAGFTWIWLGAGAGLLGLLVPLVPGILLTASGGAKLLWPGDRRIQEFAALGGAIGVVFAIPGIYVVGLGSALWLMGLSAASFVAAGHVAVRQEPAFEQVPAPEPSLWLAAQVAADEVILGTMAVSLPMPRSRDAQSIRAEVDDARALFSDRGWLEKPGAYHQKPPALESPSLRDRDVRLRHGRTPFEHLRFESGYEPRAEEPGRDRWLGYRDNRTAHAWVLRHADSLPDGRPRPWLICIHGYQMGSPLVDLGAFDPAFYHHKLGCNLLLPVLPLHGPRKMGRRSGDGFLAANPLDSIHAEAQAMWDIGRMLRWAREQEGAVDVGVHGLSLGGYNAALFSCVADDLNCVIPGIPATDFARLFWRHGPDLQIRYMEHQGVIHDEVAEVMQVISPLTLETRVPHEHRAIFGGVADRLVPPDQVRDLWLHWDKPELVWYQGSHMSFMLHRNVRELIGRTIRNSGACVEAA
ncbi:MAG: alpha/beta hydrolase family protein [Myxococcota bacterium]